MFNDINLIEVLNSLSDGVYVTDRDRVIRYWNRGAERISGFTRGDAVGHSCKDGLLTHVDASGKFLCGEHCPLLATLKDGMVHEAEVFLHHKNGHRVPVHVTSAPIRDGTGEIVAIAETFHDSTPAYSARQQVVVLEKIAMADELTGLPNRRCLDLRLQQRLDEFSRYGWPVTVMLADIDHFKKFNDTHGHDVGDKVLKMVGAALASSVRTTDIVGRWGGEEFLGILTTCSTDAIHTAGERSRVLVEQSYLTIRENTFSATVSIGLAEVRNGDTPETIAKRADGALYQSKQSGRNRITIASAS